MEHVVLFPHLGSASVATRGKMDQLVVDNLLAWAAGKPPLTPVPETPWPPKERDVALVRDCRPESAPVTPMRCAARVRWSHRPAILAGRFRVIIPIRVQSDVV